MNWYMSVIETLVGQNYKFGDYLWVIVVNWVKIVG